MKILGGQHSQGCCKVRISGACHIHHASLLPQCVAWTHIRCCSSHWSIRRAQIRWSAAKLLARRAGARLETLVIDEGFGSQDAKGRERLVEAITSVQGEFKHILVITHIQELKDMFPVQIEITKTAQGSTWAIA